VDVGPATNNVFKEAGVVSIAAKQGDIIVQSQLDPRAILQAKHVRDILATGRMDPQPAGDCGVCLCCTISNSETVVPAVAFCATVDQFSKSRIIRYEVESEALSSVLPTSSYCGRKDVIVHHRYFVPDVVSESLKVGVQPELAQDEWDFKGWQRLLSDERESRPHSENCSHRRVCVNCCQRTMLQFECASHRCGAICFFHRPC